MTAKKKILQLGLGVAAAALLAAVLKCSPFVRQCGIIEIYQ